MLLYLRSQVEEFAWKKWGSSEALDVEFERRDKAAVAKKEKKTRTSLWDSTQLDLKIGAKAMGDHEHVFASAVDKGNGLKKQTCTTCGMAVEFEEF
ncbi:hypothetical protein HDU91_004175 [Kappamyces sp. JEL0680]|nr:hypothetical protein HDU91_004175 [Kappamyces sp. JEL0680]